MVVKIWVTRLWTKSHARCLLYRNCLFLLWMPLWNFFTSNSSVLGPKIRLSNQPYYDKFRSFTGPFVHLTDMYYWLRSCPHPCINVLITSKQGETELGLFLLEFREQKEMEKIISCDPVCSFFTSYLDRWKMSCACQGKGVNNLYSIFHFSLIYSDLLFLRGLHFLHLPVIHVLIFF